MRWIFLFLTLFGFVCSRAQEVFYGGFFPEFSLTKKISSKMHGTFKVESQHGLYDHQEVESWEYFHDRTDLQFFVGRSLTPLIKVDVGYQYRVDPSGGNNHRLIQQIAFIQRLASGKIGHRIRTDQTFSEDEEDVLYRIRYRLAYQKPLQGAELDPGEFYLSLSNELIYAYEAGDQEFENRLVGSLGYVFSDTIKMESGMDYRTDRFIAPGFRQRLWWKTGAYLAF
tara:strand:- start:2780 stop:3457 length:678 start_codon:yes stop_codon:yes gene_type:complete